MMELLKSTELRDWLIVFSTLVTGFATIALWWATKNLVTTTKDMASRSDQAFIVATLEPNAWSMRHVDLHISNTGTGSAFDISIAFDPPLENGETREELPIPLQNLSLLRPQQSISSYLGQYALIEGRVYKITIKWRRLPTSKNVETLTYAFDTAVFNGISNLGAADPQIQIAEQLKKLREDWQSVAKGSQRTEINIHSSIDRNKETQERMKQIRELRKAQTTPKSNL